MQNQALHPTSAGRRAWIGKNWSLEVLNMDWGHSSCHLSEQGVLRCWGFPASRKARASLWCVAPGAGSQRITQSMDFLPAVSGAKVLASCGIMSSMMGIMMFHPASKQTNKQMNKTTNKQMNKRKNEQANK